MADLISREAAKAAIRNKFITIPMRCEVNEILNDIPAVDAVPVVRCRECKHYRRNAHDRGVDDLCDLWNVETRAKEYCSKGERRGSDA